MSNLETIKALITLGEKARQAQSALQAEIARYEYRSKHPTPGGTGTDVDAACENRDDAKEAFLVAAANARPALAGLVEEFKGLLEAAHQALGWIEGHEMTHGREFGVGNALREVIAKAEGK